MLKAENIGVRYGDFEILKGAGFSLAQSEWLMVVGPNGAGKSTLVNAVAQGLPYTGRVLFEGKDLAQDKPRVRARKIGVLMQNNPVSFSFSVEEVVRLGRYAYSGGLFAPPPADDAAMVEEALAMTGLLQLRHHSVLELSGGELQRTFLAQIFAQDPKVLLLDEPVNHLDLIYQKQIFDLIRNWAARPGRAVASVVHDLSLAKAYGTHALLLNGGRVVAEGKVDEVLCGAFLNEVYAMDVAAWMRDMLGQWGA